jgi:hypothetical protein
MYINLMKDVLKSILTPGLLVGKWNQNKTLLILIAVRQLYNTVFQIQLQQGEHLAPELYIIYYVLHLERGRDYLQIIFPFTTLPAAYH